MHRSGTSAAARVLSLCGASLPADLMPAAADQNPAGFWESEGVVAFNDELLRSLGSRWDDMFGLRLSANGELTRPDVVRAAAEVIDRAFGGADRIVLKDPRISLLMPTWREALASLGYEPAHVLMIRNPLETAASLATRNQFPVAKSLLLWTSYTLAAERFTRASSRAVLRYSDLLADWRPATRRLREQLGPRFAEPDPEAAASIDDFLKREFRHHAVSDEAAPWQQDAWGGARAVYESMADLDSPAARQRLDGIAQRLLDAGEIVGDLLVRREMELQDLKQEIAEDPRQASQPDQSRLARAAEHWSKVQAGPQRTRWWQSPLIVSHINRNYCGKAVRGTDGGDIELLRQIGEGRCYERAVSVGCGGAHHEIRLLQEDVVGAFDLFEISEARAEAALARARQLGLEDRVTIRLEDAFAVPPEPRYDLVYWKDALHHMFDAFAAVRWSREVLKSGGMFFMNDFVGPSLMQYTDRQLDLAERARAALPEPYLTNPHRPEERVPLRRARPNPARMAEIDPSECADSSNILPAVRSVFPDAVVIPTGGIVYTLALNDILANFDEERDEALLRSLMLADDLCVEAGETLYGVAYARKST